MAAIHKQSGAGLTAEEAQEMLDLGLPFVRHRGQEETRHWAGAILKGVIGDKAVIQPLNHGRTEEVPLADIKPWKSKNGKSLEEARKQQGKDMRFAIIDAKESLIWGGAKKGFIRRFSDAVLYESAEKAALGMGGMKRSNKYWNFPEKEEIKIVPVERAEAILERWQPKKQATPELKPQDQQSKQIPEQERPIVRDAAPAKSGDAKLDALFSIIARSNKRIEDAHLEIMEARGDAERATAEISQIMDRRSIDAITTTGI